MRIEIEVGLDIVDAFPDCDVSRSLMRYADKIADEARERWPDASVSWKIDTQCGFGVRLDGLEESDTAWLREAADALWVEHDKWLCDPRAEALAEHLDDDVTGYGPRLYTAGRAEWLVLTEGEADDLCAEHIAETLWALKAEFLASHFPRSLNQRAIKALAKLQVELCDDANPLIAAIVDVDDVVRDAIAADGRGHFLAGYDGNEVELDGGLFAYRVG